MDPNVSFEQLVAEIVQDVLANRYGLLPVEAMRLAEGHTPALEPVLVSVHPVVPYKPERHTSTMIRQIVSQNLSTFVKKLGTNEFHKSTFISLIEGCTTLTLADQQPISAGNRKTRFYNTAAFTLKESEWPDTPITPVRFGIYRLKEKVISQYGA